MHWKPKISGASVRPALVAALCVLTAQCVQTTTRPRHATEASCDAYTADRAAKLAAEATAKQRAEELGYDPSAMQVSIDADNSTWEGYLDLVPSLLVCRPALREALEGRYWTVHFSSARASTRDLFVFASGDGRRVLGEIHGR
jgi:hypothetical protein